MIETNVPHSEGDDAQAVQYLPPFSRKRLTRGQWQLAFTLMGASVFICIVVVAAQIITVPYVSYSPGNVYSLSDAVQVDGGEGEFAIYPPESDMGFVTVRRSNKLTLWRLFFDSLDTRIDIDRHADIYQGRSQEEIDRLRSMQMLGSQGDAVEIALRHLGKTRVTLMPDILSPDFEDALSCFFAPSEEERVVESLQKFRRSFFPLLPDGATAVNQVAGIRLLANSENGSVREALNAHWQSSSKFLLADTVVSVNGKPAGNTADMRAALEGIEPGESVRLEMQFFDRPVRQVTAKLDESLSEDEGSFSLAFEDVGLSDGASGDQDFDLECPDAQTWSFFDWPDLELITKVTFDTGDVGGPSAGLAFALAVVDLLTEGDLTGGLKVATTGIFRTPFSDEVSSVGGVRQKTAAVRNSGYDVFLVPHNDYDEAVSAAGDKLRVERVSTLRDALATLACLRGPIASDTPIASGATAPETNAATSAATNAADLPVCS